MSGENARPLGVDVHEALLSKEGDEVEEGVPAAAPTAGKTRVEGQFRLLVTGGRAWDDVETIERTLEAYRLCASQVGLELIVIHGACYPEEDENGVRPLISADWIAHLWCQKTGVKDEAYPAQWKLGPAAGPLRNAYMVHHCNPDECAAFPHGESRGTYGCANIARKAGIPVTEVPYGGEEPPA